MITLFSTFELQKYTKMTDQLFKQNNCCMFRQNKRIPQNW